MLARIQSYLLQGIDALPCEIEIDFNESAMPGPDGRPPPTIIVGLPDAGVRESQERVRSAMGNSGLCYPMGRVVINLAPADVKKEGPVYDLAIAVGLLVVSGVIRSPEADAQRPARITAPRRASLSPEGQPLGKALGKALSISSDSLAGGGNSPQKDARSCGLMEASEGGDSWELESAEGAVGLFEGGGDGRGGDGRGGDEADAEFASVAEVDPLDYRRFIFAGELALDGRLRPVKGVIALAAMAKARGFSGVVVPAENANEASVVPGIEVYGARTLSEVIGWLSGRLAPAKAPSPDLLGMLQSSMPSVDFGDVRGQEGVKRAIVVAAAGSHNLLMLGPPGSGKTMMAKALPGVLPALTPEEAIEITRIYSAAGMLPTGQGLITSRPVRSPHHTASTASIVGGGAVPRPGEISLAHRGVLFLDELPEFPRDALEALRQPLEDHVVTIARSHSAVRFPANMMLIAAMNPTPKGDMPVGEIGKRAMDQYLSRLSGPLLDRIDIHVEAPAVAWSELSRGARGTEGAGASERVRGVERMGGVGGSATHRGVSAMTRVETTASMREKVAKAIEIQRRRQGPSRPNARLSGRELDEFAALDETSLAVLGQAMSQLGLSARAYDKIRRVSRTIADLDESEAIQLTHVTEAISYRLLDRK